MDPYLLIFGNIYIVQFPKQTNSTEPECSMSIISQSDNNTTSRDWKKSSLALMRRNIKKSDKWLFFVPGCSISFSNARLFLSDHFYDTNAANLQNVDLHFYIFFIIPNGLSKGVSKPLVLVLMLRPFFPELVMATDLLGFEHPSILPS